MDQGRGRRGGRRNWSGGGRGCGRRRGDGLLMVVVGVGWGDSDLLLQEVGEVFRMELWVGVVGPLFRGWGGIVVVVSRWYLDLEE